MKDIFRYLLSGLMLMLMLTACSKQPVQEINAARTAVDTAISEGAEKYAPAEAKNLNEALTAAMNEVQTQDKKFLRDYKTAIVLLAKVKTDADLLRSGLAARKEEAKKTASAALESAMSAVDEAKNILTQLSKAKGARISKDSLAADVKVLEEAIPDARKLIDTEDYTTALDKANLIKERADKITEQIKQAMGNAAKTEPKPAAQRTSGKK